MWLYILVLFVRPVQLFIFLPADAGVVIARKWPISPGDTGGHFGLNRSFTDLSCEAELTRKNTLRCSQCGYRLFLSSELLTSSWCVLHPQQRRDQIRPFHKCSPFPGIVELWSSLYKANIGIQHKICRAARKHSYSTWLVLIPFMHLLLSLWWKRKNGICKKKKNMV